MMTGVFMREEIDSRKTYLSKSFSSHLFTYTRPEQNGGMWKDLKIKGAPIWVLPYVHILRRKGTLDSGTEVEDLVKRNIAHRDIDSYREFY